MKTFDEIYALATAPLHAAYGETFTHPRLAWGVGVTTGVGVAMQEMQQEIEQLKDSKCDLIAGLERDKKLLLDQMAFLLTATMGGHLSKHDHDALVMDSIKIIEGMTYMPFTSYVHVIRAGG